VENELWKKVRKAEEDQYANRYNSKEVKRVKKPATSLNTRGT